ncbi:hypothetical protein O3P69_020874 [Scylla paramamosain]|uniref:Myb/SANT-like DNA-binding domain-containing protein n=1 Tax=Scylla paramamosain TaxID=85552 RepID=A0AAW0TPX9_SCYPA
MWSPEVASVLSASHKTPPQNALFVAGTSDSLPQSRATDTKVEEVDNPAPRESLTQEGVQKQRKGGKVKEVWNYEATEALLQLVKANYTRLNDKKTTKGIVWKDITRVLQELIPGVELRQVEGKWRNLKSIFHNYEDYNRSSGKRKKTEPRFYNLLSSILKNRPLSRPDLCVLEGTEVGTRSVAEMEVDNPVEEDPATQASSVLNIPATPASLLDPQQGEASQRAPTPPQASPPDPQPAHASQAPQPAPATREEPPAVRGFCLQRVLSFSFLFFLEV